MPLSQLAVMADTTAGTLAMIEAWRREPRLTLAVRLETITGLHPREFLRPASAEVGHG